MKKIIFFIGFSLLIWMSVSAGLIIGEQYVNTIQQVINRATYYEQLMKNN